MADLVMPRLSDTMEEGTILRWLKSDGEAVSRGEELIEIETDKATMTYESDLEGVLQIVAAEGQTLPVGEVIAHVGAAGDAPRAAEAPASPQQVPAAPAGDGHAPDGDARAATAAQERASGAAARVKASPLARRIARLRGVDLGAVPGTGPGGRIVKADVEGSGTTAAPAQAAEARTAPAAPAETAAATPAGVATAKGEATVLDLNRTQQTIARRMAESKATIPDFSLQAEVDMEACVRLRAELKRLAPTDPAAAERASIPTYNDMVVKASALALREHPVANGSYRDGTVELHSRVNVGVAVAVERALVVPTVFDADEKSLGEISRETRALAERVRAGTITPPELGGGTFTVSNLGMYGVRNFSAIINPPQAAILSVGALEQRAVVHEGELAMRNTMALTLVCDHRVLYGADAAQLLARIRELLQAPAALTL